uniref:Methyltransferase type 11 n=1 Tax=uncultured organism MedDCM-OCT-S09-C426 TaxID=743650 RepID=D6PL19_9ZZZZ|nr:methyltransferase type 11 [uncultured organism MedDCM-OCT-S09-C426]
MNYLEDAESWCEESESPKVQLCCGKEKIDGYIGVDLVRKNGVDIIRDLNKEWPFESESVGLFLAKNALEYLNDPLHSMKEIHRCLKPDGYALIQVPSSNGKAAFENPLHKSYWNINSFSYYTNNNLAEYIDSTAKFNLLDAKEYYSSEQCEKAQRLYVGVVLRK